MTVLAQPHRMDDETTARLRTTVTALYRGGTPVEEAMRYTERACGGANCEFDPDGIDLVISVYGGRYDGAQIVGAVPFVLGAPHAGVDTVDATPETIEMVDATPGDAASDVVLIDTRVDLDETPGGATDTVETTAPTASSNTSSKKK